MSYSIPPASTGRWRIAGIIDEAAARGVFSAEGEEWRRQRKLVMQALTPEVINRFHPALSAMTERLRRRWLAAAEAGQPQRLLRDLKAFALDVIIGMAMGQDQDMLEHEDNLLQQGCCTTSPPTCWKRCIMLLRHSFALEVPLADGAE